MNENENKDLPISLGQDSDRLERELVLKQLLYLRQDINELKSILLKDKYNGINEAKPSNPAL